MEQASSGPKGKVKTEALKKEREAQVLISHPVFSKCIFSSLLMVDHGMLNTGTGLNVSECRMLQNMKTGGLRMMLGAATVAIIFFK